MPHFRYGKGRGVISYPLVSDQYVALITQAIPCSQYEAIAMFEALFKQKSSLPLLKNFSDSHGQSLLAFAFSKLLHIDLLPRLRTRKHKMLYKTSKEKNYENLDDAIHGVIREEYIRKYYDDILRILASFYERKASPAVRRSRPFDMIGKFDINLKRSTPFKFAQREGEFRQD